MTRVFVLFFGVLTHLTFLGAVGTMLVALHEGMQIGLGTLHGVAAWLANGALLLSFPVLHSYLLSAGGRRRLAGLWPGVDGKALVTTSYALIASLQLLAVFLAWSPSGQVWFAPTGALAVAWDVLFGAAWLFLGKAIWDGGLLLQTGALGWTSVWRGRAPAYGPLRTGGLFARCRQPIYFGFAATLWTGPVWTPDHLVIALPWTFYCVLGPLWKERRFMSWHGSAFAEYQARVPYFFPRILP